MAASRHCFKGISKVFSEITCGPDGKSCGRLSHFSCVVSNLCAKFDEGTRNRRREVHNQICSKIGSSPHERIEINMRCGYCCIAVPSNARRTVHILHFVIVEFWEPPRRQDEFPQVSGKEINYSHWRNHEIMRFAKRMLQVQIPDSIRMVESQKSGEYLLKQNSKFA